MSVHSGTSSTSGACAIVSVSANLLVRRDSYHPECLMKVSTGIAYSVVGVGKIAEKRKKYRDATTFGNAIFWSLDDASMHDILTGMPLQQINLSAGVWEAFFRAKTQGSIERSSSFQNAVTIC